MSKLRALEPGEVRWTRSKGHGTYIHRRTEKGNLGNEKWRALTELQERWGTIKQYTPQLEQAYQEVKVLGMV